VPAGAEDHLEATGSGAGLEVPAGTGGSLGIEASVAAIESSATAEPESE
jgi:hypothetical protein